MMPPRRRRLHTLLATTAAVSLLLVLFVTSSGLRDFKQLTPAHDMPEERRRGDVNIPPPPPRQPRLQLDVVIYAATAFFGMNITAMDFLNACSSRTWCRISENRDDFEKASAVVFHNADYDMQDEELQPRQPHVPYILWSLESPSSDIFYPGPGVVNWTMTYRRDADVWYPYGHMVKRRTRPHVDYEQIWQMKTANATATWLASNCHADNRREWLVELLQENGLATDRWGACGRPPPGCDGVDKQSAFCVVDLVRPYKFYMSFENANCVDYVTEKFYETLGTRMAVPLVIKGSIYTELGIPADSFIALDDFRSIREMADFLNSVAANKTAYLAYHKWREQFEVIVERNDETGFCLLCRRLQERELLALSQDGSEEETEEGKTKSYDSSDAWHAEGGRCDQDYAWKFL